MNFKTVTKSKSSNGAMGSKAENKNKKSLSNAAFRPSVVKKRGVYVEKKTESSTNTQEANYIRKQQKPPRRPRLGQDKFLASVLTILSKSTAATQYPDVQDRTEEKTRCMPQCKKTYDLESKSIQKTIKPKKAKYRSRVLNDEMLEKEQLIILQPKKEISQTPSQNSVTRVKTACDPLNLADENESKRSAIRNILENTIYSGVAEGITHNVLEGKPKKEYKLHVNDDPETIASEIAKKDDKNMYNFFVDLLETTISAYNVKIDYEMSDVSKNTFEIDDAVVEKLEIVKNHNRLHENVNHTSKYERELIIEKENFDATENYSIDAKPSDYRMSSSIKPKIKAKSFLIKSPNKNIISTRKAKSAPKSNSFENKKYRKPNKKQILDHLKNELEKETYTFDEPESLYDALKVMAKNKRRNERSINFVDKIDTKDLECMFERRKILTFGSRKNNKVKQIKVPTYESRYSQKTKDLSNRRHFPSSHSLEVYGYDYEEPSQVKQCKRDKRIVFNYHSSASNSESLGDYNASINYTDRSGSFWKSVKKTN